MHNHGKLPSNSTSHEQHKQILIASNCTKDAVIELHQRCSNSTWLNIYLDTQTNADRVCLDNIPSTVLADRGRNYFGSLFLKRKMMREASLNLFESVKRENYKIIQISLFQEFHGNLHITNQLFQFFLNDQR